MRRSRNALALSAITALIMVSFQNCSTEAPEAAKSGNFSSQAANLSVPTTTVEIESGQSFEIKPSGGVKPYVFTLVSGSGIVDTAGLFVGPASNDISVVEVKDAKDATVAVTITSIAPLALGHAPMAPKTTEIVQLTPSGGKPPYTLQLLAGVGTLNGNAFSPGITASATNWFRLTDSTGKVVEKSITVAATPTINIYYYYMIVSDDSGTTTYPFYSPNDNEATGGYQLGGVRGSLFAESAPGRTAVRRCRSGNFNMYSYLIRGNCSGGYTDIGIVGYVSDTQVPNTRPIYSNNANNYFSSVWTFTVSGGLTLMGYVP